VEQHIHLQLQQLMQTVLEQHLLLQTLHRHQHIHVLIKDMRLDQHVIIQHSQTHTKDVLLVNLTHQISLFAQMELVILEMDVGNANKLTQEFIVLNVLETVHQFNTITANMVLQDFLVMEVQHAPIQQR
jgi:hypothetical protein